MNQASKDLEATSTDKAAKRPKRLRIAASITIAVGLLSIGLYKYLHHRPYCYLDGLEVMAHVDPDLLHMMFGMNMPPCIPYVPPPSCNFSDTATNASKYCRAGEGDEDCQHWRKEFQACRKAWQDYQNKFDPLNTGGGFHAK